MKASPRITDSVHSRFLVDRENLDQVLERFKQSGMHTALVVDEYGGFQGLVTPSHILEAIVGEMPEAGEPAEPAAVRREDGSWLVDRVMPVDE